MKSIKKMLKSQLEKAVPPLDEDIKNLPIDTPDSQNIKNGKDTLARSKKAIIASVCAVVILAIIGISLACTLPFRISDESMLFTVEINPSATIVTDKNGIVTNIISSNPDADVILSDSGAKSKIIGKPLDVAIVNYTDAASMLGFIDVTKKGSAVRISACEKGENLLGTAKHTLESYFIDKGIFAVVISETVNLEEFKNRSGIVADSFNALLSAVKDSRTLYNDRSAQGADAKTLLSLYKEFILSAEMVPIVKDYMLENIELIEQLESLYPIIPLDQLKAILDDLSAELLAQYSNLFAEIFRLMGLSDEIIDIMHSPKNAQEFLNKLTAVLKIEFTHRKNEFENAYNELSGITEKQYENFVDEIINSYGSLDEYWKSIK